MKYLNKKSIKDNKTTNFILILYSPNQNVTFQNRRSVWLLYIQYYSWSHFSLGITFLKDFWMVVIGSSLQAASISYMASKTVYVFKKSFKAVVESGCSSQYSAWSIGWMSEVVLAGKNLIVISESRSSKSVGWAVQLSHSNSILR